MRIAMLAPELPSETVTGGIAETTVEVADALQALGHDVTVFASRDEVDSADLRDSSWALVAWDRSLADRVRYLARRARGWSWQKCWALQLSEGALREVRRTAANHGPFDVVDSWLWRGLGAAYARMSLEMPLITRASTPEDMTTGQVSTSTPNDLLQLHQVILAGSSAVISPSSANVQQLRTRFELPQDRVHVVPHAAALPTRSRTRAPGECVHVVCVGRLERRKGTDVLIEAAKWFMPFAMDSKLILIGRTMELGPSGSTYADFIFETLGPLAPRVEVRGHVSSDEKSALLNDAAVAVVPSRYESFGIVAAEAMAHGTPVVVSDIGGLPEVVGDQAGVLVPVEDPKALGMAIKDLLLDPRRRDEVGKAGLQRTQTTLSNQSVIEKTMSVYRAACVGTNRPSSA